MMYVVNNQLVSREQLVDMIISVCTDLGNKAPSRATYGDGDIRRNAKYSAVRIAKALGWNIENANKFCGPLPQ